MTIQSNPSAMDAATVLQELVKRAMRGDQSVLPRLREILDDCPKLWETYGDLGRLAKDAWLKLLAGPDLMLSEAVNRKLEELRVELSGPQPSPLEKLLIDRILAGWLQVHYADISYPQVRELQSTAAARQELMRRQESAQRRYLASIRQLALVRRLIKPVLSPFEVAMRMNGKPTANQQKTPDRGLRLAEVN